MLSSWAGLNLDPEADAGGGAGRFRVSVECETLILRRWRGEASQALPDRFTKDSMLKDEPDLITLCDNSFLYLDNSNHQ